MSTRAAELRRRILDLTAEYFAEAFPARDFVAGESAVPVSGKVIDASDIQAVVDSALDCWLTTGRFADGVRAQAGRFCRRALRLAGQLRLLGQPARRLRAHLAEAGQTAGLQPGDEVITVAAGFPTTVNPIIQNRLRAGVSSM